MALIVARTKTHEFRKVHYAPTITRVWFYETAPISAIRYICDIGPPIIRPPPSNTYGAHPALLPKDGRIGNADYNSYHVDYDRYDYAYPILSCYQVNESITLKRLKQEFGIKGAPRGLVYLPGCLKDAVGVDDIEKLW